MDAGSIFAFFGRRAVPGVESWDGHTYRRALRLTHGDAVLSVHAPTVGPRAAGDDQRGWLPAEVVLGDRRDLDAAQQVARRLFDLDADPGQVDAVLGADQLFADAVRHRPGVRVPGAADGTELLVRAVLGQQISVTGARTLAARLAREHGEPLTAVIADPTITHHFPRAASLAELDPATLPMPGARARSLVAACAAVAAGHLDLDLDRPADEERTASLRRQLLALAGIGPWTADYVLMRGLGRRDRFLSGDLVVRRTLERLGVGAAEVAARVASWAPWQAYAVQHLWLLSALDTVRVGDGNSARPSGPDGHR